MVQITRSFTWEEFRQDFIYDWIEMLRVLDEYNDAASTSRLLWMLVMYAFAVVLFVTACSLMLIFYRRVDPRHPSMKPQRLTFRELFLDLKSTGETGFFEKRTVGGGLLLSHMLSVE
ncbi:hypothetical protein GCK32_020132 [Trichostrongylus colubriformis]|uniref:Uncharacterized protein n=1 Tax=Trichostrongylus colubriformis TaxID=6319 RepID=A0AAN8IQS3_TRICO